MDKYDRYESWLKECRDRGLEPRMAAMELRVDGDKPPTLVGYAAKFDKWSEDLGGFKEIVRPGAFSRAIREGQDVRAFVEHDPSKVIGRTKSKTLDISEDKTGLRVVIRPPDTQAANDMMASLRRGDVDQMSFAFRTIKDSWNENFTERELLDVDLFDVSVVSVPAYTDTVVAERSCINARREAMLRAKVAAMGTLTQG